MKDNVNDGRGLWDSDGICDRGITLCNSALKDLVSGQYIGFVNKVEQIAQIFANLKKGIKSDMESRNGTIEELKQTIRELEEQTGKPVTKEGAE